MAFAWQARACSLDFQVKMGEAVTQEGGAGGRETWQEAGPGSSSGRRASGSLSLCSLQGGGGSRVLETAPLRTLLPFPRAVVNGSGSTEGAHPGSLAS